MFCKASLPANGRQVKGRQRTARYAIGSMILSHAPAGPMRVSRYAQVACVATLTLLPSAIAGAQAIQVNAGASTSAFVAPGASLAVPIIIDRPNGGAIGLAALQATLTWNASRLSFDSLRLGGLVGWTLNTNLAGVVTGTVGFTASSLIPIASTTTLATAYFTATSPGGTHIIPAVSSATNLLGNSVLPSLHVRALDVCVGPVVKWGDANADLAVNIVDAQLIARYAAGLNVAMNATVLERGDVTGDGQINVLDAQQIARFGVALPAAARINTDFVPTPAPTALAVSPGSSQYVAMGSSVQLLAVPTAASLDISGCAATTWQSSNTAVATVNSSGFVAPVGVGSATITASVNASPSVSASTTITVGAGAIANATVTLAQSTLPLSTVGAWTTTGNPVTTATSVALDGWSNTVTATPVWSSSNPLVARVASDGTIGAGTASITATYGGENASATLTVTPAAGDFGIVVRNVAPVSPAVQAAFTSAATRWAQIIRGDLPNVSVVGLDVSSCLFQNAGTTIMTETIDDVVIYANVRAIDGVGGILGGAGPCVKRAGSGHAYVGMMTFDVDDLAAMQADGILTAVILHEMAHVLGVGSNWANVLQDAMPSASNDPIFTGTNARWAFANLGTNYDGRTVPVENCIGVPRCGSGAINAHWRELVGQRELMTGYVTVGVGALNPLSPLTAASLIDIGYVVDVAMSDAQPWFMRTQPTSPEKRIPIRELPMPPPVTTDLRGRIVRPPSH
jgi:hypothetical protein